MENETNRFSRRALVALGILGGVVVAVTCIVIAARSSSTNVPVPPQLQAAEQAMADLRFDAAVELYRKAEAQGIHLPPSSAFACAQAYLQLGKTAQAEKYLRQVVAEDPGHLGANEILCAILRVAGRNWELRPFALELMRKEFFSPGNLLALTANATELAVKRGPPEEMDLETLVMQGASAQNEITARLSHAHFLLTQNQQDEAEKVLATIVADDPDQLEAQALLGALILARNDRDKFQQWHQELPENPWTHPEIWVVAGTWAEMNDDPQRAARCYWEALRLHPDHLVATYRLSQMLAVIDRESDAARFAARAGELAEIQAAAVAGWSPPTNARDLADRLESLGRKWESLGWSYATIARDPRGDVDWARERIKRLRDLLPYNLPLVPDEVNLAKQIDLADLPKPSWTIQKAQPVDNVAEVESSSSSFRFRDDAQSAGINFKYFNSADPKRAYMFEFSGGGVGVLDYDLDGWPDIHLTQGCQWPRDPKQQLYKDQFFRNRGTGKFEDVTELAGLNATGFGQGVSVGDIDNDGFPDLYIANIGVNQLYRNNGDGTFTDITSAAGISGDVWTLSTLIADLNGDSAADLFDVNYLGGPDVYTKICLRDGKPIQCFPNEFPAEMDQLYQNTGDGRFRDVSEEAGILVPNGKGMGVVAADFDGSKRLSLFVTNDTTVNFFFLNQTPSPGADIRFDERGLLAGLAFSATGTSASHMGIAIGDANGDDRLDLYVTNFQGEPNNFYLQQDDLFFDDRIRQTRLYDPGFPYEGWGAQFMDPDLNGIMDLVVANGHLDDYPHSTGLTVMPTQVFRNQGSGQFEEMAAADLGPYFEGEYLGRAVATLDWNRDGRPDFCVTHTDAPFALLTNETPTDNHYLVLHLRGVESSRDAIGAQVTIQAGDRRYSQQLMAGDGYQASNQRILVFGLGSHRRLDEVRISWPSGAEQSFADVAADQELIVVEEQGLVTIPRDNGS